MDIPTSDTEVVICRHHSIISNRRFLERPDRRSFPPKFEVKSMGSQPPCRRIRFYIRPGCVRSRCPRRTPTRCGSHSALRMASFPNGSRRRRPESRGPLPSSTSRLWLPIRAQKPQVCVVGQQRRPSPYAWVRRPVQALKRQALIPSVGQAQSRPTVTTRQENTAPSHEQCAPVV